MTSSANPSDGPAASPATPSAALPPLYTPAEHEDRIRATWDAAKAFHVDPARVLRGEAEPYCILIPPPNVTAALHLGHALNNTLQDVLVRRKRMQGFEALWMPGTDHAGIATQAVVEKRVMKDEGKRRQDFTREAFVAKIQAFKDEYEATITNQLKLMGCSCDWDRQRFTMDEQCAAAVYEAFFRLFKDGLIYRGKRLVNWDPVLQTAVADDECYEEDIDGNFYYLRYPLVHEVKGDADAVPVTWSELRRRGWNLAEDAEHEDDKAAWITVATTRPETYFGDTAVAINPHDPRAKALRGLFVELPLIGRVIPIVEDSYVVLPERFARNDEEKADPKAKMATGFLKVTPAHDPNDWEIGQRHELPVINIFAPDATISDKHGWSNASELKGAHNFLGKKREEARKMVVIEFKARGWHEATKPYRHSVKHSDRSKAIVEPYLSDQWYVKVTDPRLAQAANAALVSDQRVGRASPPASELPQASAHARMPKAGSNIPHAWDQGISTNKNMYIRRLPHFEKGGSTYFVTFRLAGGVPPLSDAERSVVLDACFHWHEQRGRFYAVTVMPDHVHMLVKPLEREAGTWFTLGEIMHSIKSFTAHEINKRRGSSGVVWQNEWFDRLVREGGEFDEQLAYIENNAVKAGLAAKPGDYLHLRLALPGTTGSTAAGGDARPTGTEENQITFHPARYAKTFEQWHDGIRDWCISRQLWWGHQVPVWTKSKLTPEEYGPLNESLASHAHWAYTAADEILPDGTCVNFRICLRRFTREAIAAIESHGFTRDPDVLDTWFSSALWPLSTMGWPSDTDLLKAFNPSSTLCTAREIITLWVSRMVMFNRYLHGAGGGKGPVPFKDVVIHAVIQDGEGQKMSKTLGNGIDPLDIIATHGSDAMRFTLAQMATQTQDVRMPVEKTATGRNTSSKFDLGKRLCNKLWNASRLALSKLPQSASGEGKPQPIHARDLSLVDRWMLARLATTLDAVNASLESYDFAPYATAIYDLLWRDFCDWYLEAIKPTIDNNPAQQAVLAHALEVILRLAHPAMPYVTEAIWEQVKNVHTAPIHGISLGPSRKGGLLCTAGWPVLDASLKDEAAAGAFERLREVVDQIREVRAAQQVHPKRKITLHGSDALLKELQSAGSLVSTLAGLGTMTPTGDIVSFTAPSGALKVRLLGTDAWLSDLADAVDTKAAGQMNEKRIAELEKQHGTITARLSNPGYAQRAPAKLVEESKAMLKQIEDELKVLRG